MLPAPPGFKHLNFTGGEVAIHYVEGPRTGPDLVLLHGMARDWNSFSSLIPDLSQLFHLFILDLRGHGASGRVPHGYGINQFASDVSAFMRQITPAGTPVFGHSLGAMVGMFVAASGECKVNSLIVGDSMISTKNLSNSIYHSLFSQLRTLIMMRGSLDELARGIGKIEVRLPGFDEPLLLEELAGNTPTVLREWARSAINTDPDVLKMALNATAFEDWDPQQVLPRIKCPVLLLQGNPAMDALLSDSDVEVAMRLIPRAEHVKFPLLGHALFMQQSKPILREINRFLSVNAR